MDVNRRKPAPLDGSQLLEILFKVGFLADKELGIRLLENMTAAADETCMPEGTDNNGKRILLTGVPVGLGSDKVVKIVEQCGAHMVAFENCSGYKQAFTVDEEKNPMTALTEQYLSIPCSVMSPNQGRLDRLKEMVANFKVDGVIDLTWQACHTYNVEAFRVNEFIQDLFGFPTLQLETDYSESDNEHLRVRIEAYLEMI